LAGDRFGRKLPLTGSIIDKSIAISVPEAFRYPSIVLTETKADLNKSRLKQAPRARAHHLNPDRGSGLYVK
jgi:hypothetical protein